MRPNYGIDAPGVVLCLFVIGVATILIAFVPGVPAFFVVAIPWIGGSWLATAIVMVAGSKFFKLRFRDRLVDALKLAGTERALDLGCGRGLMLVGLAKKLSNGTAVGVDLWNSSDQSGNNAASTARNARIENVEHRVQIETADMRKLPFEPHSFDCVVSTWAIHNIPDAEGRASALREAARVLKPGGQLVVADILKVGEYERVLAEIPMANLKLSRPNFLFGIPTRTIWAVKPAEANVDKNLTLS